jgi:DnaJ-class molecular chaperone
MKADCPKCHGRTVHRGTKSLKMYIPKGSLQGDIIKFSEEGD